MYLKEFEYLGRTLCDESFTHLANRVNTVGRRERALLHAIDGSEEESFSESQVAILRSYTDPNNPGLTALLLALWCDGGSTEKHSALMCNDCFVTTEDTIARQDG